MYKNAKSCVRVNGALSEELVVMVDVHQGSVVNALYGTWSNTGWIHTRVSTGMIWWVCTNGWEYGRIDQEI